MTCPQQTPVWRMNHKLLVVTPLQAVELLNQLLFGPPAAQGPGDSDTAETVTSNSVVHRSGDSSSSPMHYSWLGRSVDLDGPDLSTVVVPTDGVSGMGIKVCDQAHSRCACAGGSICACTVLAPCRVNPVVLYMLRHSP